MPLSGALYLDPATYPSDYLASNGGEPHEVARRVAVRCWPSVVAVNLPPDVGGSLPRLASSVLAGFGKDLDLGGGAPIPGKELWALSEVWLNAYRTAVLVVSGAEGLTAGLWGTLASLACDKRAVVLVNRTSKLTRGQRLLLDGAAGPVERVDYAAFCDWEKAQTCQPAGRPTVHPSTPLPARFPAVPADDVPFFLETSRRVLSADEFVQVLNAYVRGFNEANRWLARRSRLLSQDDVGAFLTELIADVSDIHAQVTRLRGAQAGFWRNGWLLKMHAEALVVAHRTEPGTRDRQLELRILQGFVLPRVAAAVLLTLRARLTPVELAALDSEQLSDDCVLLELGDGESVNFDPEEAVFLRAHILHARRQGHPATGPLFRIQVGHRMTPHRIQQTLRRAAVDTGLPLTYASSPSLERRHAHWLRRRGLTVQRLARDGIT